MIVNIIIHCWQVLVLQVSASMSLSLFDRTTDNDQVQWIMHHLPEAVHLIHYTIVIVHHLTSWAPTYYTLQANMKHVLYGRYDIVCTIPYIPCHAMPY